MSSSLTAYSNSCLATLDVAEGCRECQMACPIEALVVGDKGPIVASSCFGCGRCAVACPTGALAATGFAFQRLPTAGEDGLRIECRATPKAFLSDKSLVVPCLGGVTDEQLIAVCLAADPSDVLIVDRGWCETCPSGGGKAAADLARRIGSIYASLGLDLIAPRLTDEPLAPVHRRDPRSTEGTSRRDFLRRLAPRNPATPESPSGRWARRERRSALLNNLAARYSKPVPASLHPALAVGTGCAAHQVCAAICPTGALKAVADRTSRALSFDPTLCLACGWCVNACPESAISLHDAGPGDAFIQGEVVLARREIRTCLRCEGDFVGDGELCPVCNKSRALFASGPVAARLKAQTPEGGHTHDHA